METKFNLTVTPDADGKIPALTIFEGTAADPLPLHEAKIISLAGILPTPADWADKRKKEAGFDPLKVNVVANFTDRTIVLTIDEKNHYATTIKGTLKLHPELESLQINSQKLYDEKQLQDKLKFFQRFFVNSEGFEKLNESLKKFTAKIDMAFQNVDDFKGTKALQKAYEIKHTVPLDFSLNMPVFAGGENRTFAVEILISIDGSRIIFWLQSVGLHTIIQEETEDMFEEQLKRLQEYAIVKQY